MAVDLNDMVNADLPRYHPNSSATLRHVGWYGRRHVTHVSDCKNRNIWSVKAQRQAVDGAHGVHRLYSSFPLRRIVLDSEPRTQGRRSKLGRIRAVFGNVRGKQAGHSLAIRRDTEYMGRSAVQTFSCSGNCSLVAESLAVVRRDSSLFGVE